MIIFAAYHLNLITHRGSNTQTLGNNLQRQNIKAVLLQVRPQNISFYIKISEYIPEISYMVIIQTSRVKLRGAMLFKNEKLRSRSEAIMLFMSVIHSVFSF